MLKISNTTLKIVGLFMFSVLAFLSFSGDTHAASITVGTDINPNTCSLAEAIENINDQAQTNADCVETGTYGTDDTITIPVGTINLTANLPTITNSVTIQGAGMGQTTIDGDGQWDGLHAFSLSAEILSVRDLLVSNYAGGGISIEGMSLTVQRVEVNGGGNVVGVGAISGIAMLAMEQDLDLLIEDSYIHDIGTINDQVGIVAGILLLNGKSLDATIRRTTVSSINSASPSTATAGAIFGLTGLFDGQGTPADFVIDYENLTAEDVNSASGAVGIGFGGLVNGGTSHISGSLKNVTVVGVQSTAIPAGVSVSAAAFTPDDNYIVDLELQNLLMDTAGTHDCYFADEAANYGATGTATINIASAGGNLSSDTTCSPYFTHPTDQNNVAALAATLGPLGNNGGFVPTIPLLEGSPAIDAGITIAGLTTDARQAIRPQGTAYDSGAYESPYRKPQASLAETGENIKLAVGIAMGLVVGAGAILAVRHRRKK